MRSDTKCSKHNHPDYMLKELVHLSIGNWSLLRTSCKLKQKQILNRGLLYSALWTIWRKFSLSGIFHSSKTQKFRDWSKTTEMGGGHGAWNKLSQSRADAEWAGDGGGGGETANLFLSDDKKGKGIKKNYIDESGGRSKRIFCIMVNWQFDDESNNINKLCFQWQT